jgi:hypothetical protein
MAAENDERRIPATSKAARDIAVQAEAPPATHDRREVSGFRTAPSDLRHFSPEVPESATYPCASLRIADSGGRIGMYEIPANSNFVVAIRASSAQFTRERSLVRNQPCPWQTL